MNRRKASPTPEAPPASDEETPTDYCRNCGLAIILIGDRWIHQRRGGARMCEGDKMAAAMPVGKRGADAPAPAEAGAPTAEELAERLRKYLHDTYNGGHHEEPAHGAFHHGMDTVCNVLAHERWLAVYAAPLTAQLEEARVAQEHLGIAKKRLNAIVGEGNSILPLISRVEAMHKRLADAQREIERLKK